VAWCSRKSQLGRRTAGGGGHQHGGEEDGVEWLRVALSGGLACGGGLRSSVTHGAPGWWLSGMLQRLVGSGRCGAAKWSGSAKAAKRV
jgi:hypothetical protein